MVLKPNYHVIFLKYESNHSNKFKLNLLSICYTQIYVNYSTDFVSKLIYSLPIRHHKLNEKEVEMS